MKKILRSLLPFLLVFAMLLPLSGIAQAVDATSVTLSTEGTTTLYYRDADADGGRADAVTITATAKTAEKKEYDGTIKWTVEDGKTDFVEPSLTLDTELDYKTAANRSITLKAKQADGNAPTSVSVTAYVKTGNSSMSFVIVQDEVQPFSLTITDGTELEVGKTTTASHNAKYESGDKASVVYSSSDKTVATVDKDGNIEALKVGTATITATAAGGVKAEKTLTVVPVSFRYTAGVGQSFSLKDLYKDLIRNYAEVRFDDKDTVTFSNIDSSAKGALYLGKSTLVNKSACTFGQLESVTFESKVPGDFTFNVSVKHGSAEYTGEVTITSTVSSVDIYIPIGGNDEYRFTDQSANGKTGVKIVTDAFSDFAAVGSFVFDVPSSASRKLGTLSATADESGSVANLDWVNWEDLAKLRFIPLRDTGTFEIKYNAYSEKDGKGAVIAKGTLSIALNAESLDVTVSLDSTEPYTFSDKNGTSTLKSAKDLLTEAIDGVLGSTGWGGICFDTNKLSPESDAVGVLYLDDSSTRPANEVDSSDFITKAALGKLVFDPDGTGNYIVGFSVYASASSGTLLASGTLTISVANDLNSMDFGYVAKIGETIELNEEDFIAFVQKRLGIRYELTYITLDSAGGSGTFYLGREKIIPGRTDEFYASENIYAKAPKNADYIEDLRFTAPSKAGITTVRFTAYALRSASDPRPEAETGTFYIIYTASDVPVITFTAYDTGNAYSAAKLDEASFVKAYQKAIGSTEAKPTFQIRFQTLPLTGIIYRNFDFTRGTGVSLTNSNIGSASFTVGAGTSAWSVSSLCYVPTLTVGVVETATYLALDDHGVPLYTGTIQFLLSAPKSVEISSEGLDFTAADFNDLIDPILYVTFAAPDSGKLYVYDGSRMIPVTESTRLWITDSKMGDYPVSSAHYIPRAGQTATITLTYTAHTLSGNDYKNSIIVKPISRTVSARYPDVDGVTGSWAANSVDFASKYGYVKGKDGGKFDPEASMLRRDLILIFYRMAGSPKVSGQMPYTDVPAGSDSYTTEIYNSALWAAQKGIVEGIVTGATYGPQIEVTRQEYIRILYNYTKAMGGSVSKKASLDAFSDVAEIDSFALEAMQWAVANNYTTGTDAVNPKLSPKNVTRRAEIVTFLHRYLTY